MGLIILNHGQGTSSTPQSASPLHYVRGIILNGAKAHKTDLTITTRLPWPPSIVCINPSAHGHSQESVAGILSEITPKTAEHLPCGGVKSVESSCWRGLKRKVRAHVPFSSVDHGSKLRDLLFSLMNFSNKAGAMKVARLNETIPQAKLRRLDQAKRDADYEFNTERRTWSLNRFNLCLPLHGRFFSTRRKIRCCLSAKSSEGLRGLLCESTFAAHNKRSRHGFEEVSSESLHTWSTGIPLCATPSTTRKSRSPPH
ncbi:hypothetical protein TNCV_4537281 [Trichonephila clavipes]|nr:hypothetical protein TNCV_4537281 [Trichonephila clavipes]